MVDTSLLDRIKKQIHHALFCCLLLFGFSRTVEETRSRAQHRPCPDSPHTHLRSARRPTAVRAYKRWTLPWRTGATPPAPCPAALTTAGTAAAAAVVALAPVPLPPAAPPRRPSRRPRPTGPRSPCSAIRGGAVPRLVMLVQGTRVPEGPTAAAAGAAAVAERRRRPYVRVGWCGTLRMGRNVGARVRRLCLFFRVHAHACVCVFGGFACRQ